jgi:group I intron endonuclease
MYGIIYLLTNTVNGKIYVGQTKRRLDQRWRGHVSKAKHTKELAPIVCAIRKYGAEVFTQKVLCVAHNKIQLDKLEENYTILLQANQPNIGYNIAVGACIKGEPRERATKKQTGELSYSYRHDVKDEELITLYRSGIPLQELSKRFKISRSAIDNRLEKNGVKRVDSRHKIIEDAEQICKEYLSGDTLKVIGRRRHLHYGVIRGVLIKNGISIRKIQLPLKELIRKYEEGSSVKYLANKYGVDQSTVSARLRKAGIHIRNSKESKQEFCKCMKH